MITLSWIVTSAAVAQKRPGYEALPVHSFDRTARQLAETLVTWANITPDAPLFEEKEQNRNVAEADTPRPPMHASAVSVLPVELNWSSNCVGRPPDAPKKYQATLEPDARSTATSV
jgi:hypothetical protein